MFDNLDNSSMESELNASHVSILNDSLLISTQKTELLSGETQKVPCSSPNHKYQEINGSNFAEVSINAT